MTSGNERFAGFPNHIAIIMDGNRRWAEKHGLSILEGHQAGARSLRKVVECFGNYRLPYLTVYCFSTENWNRSQNEVQELLTLLQEVLLDETEELHKHGIKIRHLGNMQNLPVKAREVITQATELTKNNKNMELSFAFNYGGRAEIIRAISSIVSSSIAPSDIDEKLVDSYLYTRGLPDVDLLIRTGGETRISNFLIWQTIYSEIYFTDTLWPDFDSAEIDKALLFYNQKQRRFGS